MRKDLLASSLQAVREGREAAKIAASEKTRKTAGVLDVQRGLDQLASGAPRMVAPDQIADSALPDRFDVSDGIEDLVTSIQISGQKLPVLLRRIKDGLRPYEVIYGRRRIEACRRLGIEVKAYISDMDDREALISQGLENAARLQRSFIEQAVYAERLLGHDFTRDEVSEVLAIDKTALSRMLGVVEAIPAAVIAAIGPAHDSGRRPWLELKEACQADNALDEIKLLHLIPADKPSTDRLKAVLAKLVQKAKAVTKPMVKRMVGDRISIERSEKRMLINCSDKDLIGFPAYLDERIDQILADYLKQNQSDNN